MWTWLRLNMRRKKLTQAFLKAHAVVDFYLGGIENMNMDHLQSIIDIFTDATFLYGLHR